MENYFLKQVADFCDRNGIGFIIENNPSPEEIEKIKVLIKKREELQKLFVERKKIFNK